MKSKVLLSKLTISAFTIKERTTTRVIIVIQRLLGGRWTYMQVHSIFIACAPLYNITLI